MDHNLFASLRVSGIGMGLVFLGIIVLWGLMELVLKFNTNREPSRTMAPEKASSADMQDAKRKAVAVAVITAFALQNTAFTASTHKNREAITAWQAAHRSHQIRTAIMLNNRRRKDH